MVYCQWVTIKNELLLRFILLGGFGYLARAASAGVLDKVEGFKAEVLTLLIYIFNMA
jgi:hypothetical protein